MICNFCGAHYQGGTLTSHSCNQNPPLFRQPIKNGYPPHELKIESLLERIANALDALVERGNT